MKKREFLDELRDGLKGNISQEEIEDNIRYYEEYFDNANKSEEEVADELGDPRLIAKSIIDSSKGVNNEKVYDADYEESYDYNNSENSTPPKMNVFLKMLIDRENMTFLEKVKFWVYLVLILAVVVALAILIVNAMVKVVIPLLLILFIIGFLVSIFS